MLAGCTYLEVLGLSHIALYNLFQPLRDLRLILLGPAKVFAAVLGGAGDKISERGRELCERSLSGHFSEEHTSGEMESMDGEGPLCAPSQESHFGSASHVHASLMPPRVCDRALSRRNITNVTPCWARRASRRGPPPHTTSTSTLTLLRLAMLSSWQAGARPAVRAFSTSAPARAGIVSNIGKQPIVYPPTVTLTPSASAMSVKGPLGETSVPLAPFMRLAQPAPQTLAVSVENPRERKQRAMWGLTRTLIHNAVVGMTEGYTLPVYLVGVGYRVALEPDPRGKGDGRSGQRLMMRLGFSHPVFISIPDHIEAQVPVPTKIELRCTDKHLLGLFAAQIRKWRPPEPYKGKVRSTLSSRRAGD